MNATTNAAELPALTDDQIDAMIPARHEVDEWEGYAPVTLEQLRATVRAALSAQSQQEPVARATELAEMIRQFATEYAERNHGTIFGRLDSLTWCKLDEAIKQLAALTAPQAAQPAAPVVATSHEASGVVRSETLIGMAECWEKNAAESRQARWFTQADAYDICAADVRRALKLLSTPPAPRPVTTPNAEADAQRLDDYATEINRLRNVIQAACSGGLDHMIERWKVLFPDAPVPTVRATTKQAAVDGQEAVARVLAEDEAEAVDIGFVDWIGGISLKRGTLLYTSPPPAAPAVPEGMVILSKDRLDGLYEWVAEQQFYPNQPEHKLINPLMHHIMKEIEDMLAPQQPKEPGA